MIVELICEIYFIINGWIDLGYGKYYILISYFYFVNEI